MKFFKKESKNQTVLYKLHVDFGYWEDSPIPSKKTDRKNFNAVVLAIPGMKGFLFPDQRPETIEFLSFIEDEKGRPCGIRCVVRAYSERIEQALFETGIAQKHGIQKTPEMELELFPDQKIRQEASDFESGVTTHIYRNYRLERIESDDRKKKLYFLSGDLYHEKIETDQPEI